MKNNILTKDSVNAAARNFITSDQLYKNRVIDEIFSSQPALIKFWKYIDKAVPNEMTKEVTIQLMCIFYKAFKIQNMKVGKIDFEEISRLISLTPEIKRYLHNPKYSFDEKAFQTFVNEYKQIEILNYTHFAINNHFKTLVSSEQEALFIFYIMKIFGEALGANVI